MDFDLIVGFEWDGGNARKSIDKHSVGQAEAEQVFFNFYTNSWPAYFSVSSSTIFSESIA